MLLIVLALLQVQDWSCQVLAQNLIQVVDVYWGEYGNPIEVDLGDKGVPLTIIARNSGSNSITNILATLHLIEPFESLSSKLSTSAYHAGTVPPGGLFHLTFYINIGEHGSYKYLYLAARTRLL